MRRPGVCTSVSAATSQSTDVFLDLSVRMAEYLDRLVSDEARPRPRRHLPSPALAKATSHWKLQSHSTSFDVAAAADADSHVPYITSSPSAPLVYWSGSSNSANGICSSSSSSSISISSNSNGRKLPVPGKRPAKLQSAKSLDPGFRASYLTSRSDDRVVSDSSFVDGQPIWYGSLVEMDTAAAAAVTSANSSTASPSPTYKSVSTATGRMCDSPKMSLSRKLPAPPVSAAGLTGANRRLLPRPLSFDVAAPDGGDSCIGRGKRFIPRPFSLDCSEEIDKQVDIRPASSSSSSSSSSDATECVAMATHSVHSAANSCSIMTRPCYASPRMSRTNYSSPVTVANSVSNSSLHQLDAPFADSSSSSLSLPLQLLEPLNQCLRDCPSSLSSSTSPALKGPPCSTSCRSPLFGSITSSSSSNNNSNSQATSSSSLSLVHQGALFICDASQSPALLTTCLTDSFDRLGLVQRQTSLPPAALLGLAVRRARYQQQAGSMASSIQETCSTPYSYNVQRPSRSRLAVKQTALAAR